MDAPQLPGAEQTSLPRWLAPYMRTGGVGGPDSLVLFVIIFMLSLIFRKFIFHAVNVDSQIISTRIFVIMTMMIWVAFTSMAHKSSATFEIIIAFSMSLIYVPIIGLLIYISGPNPVDYELTKMLTMGCAAYLAIQCHVVAIVDKRDDYAQKFLVGTMILLLVTTLFFVMIFIYSTFIEMSNNQMHKLLIVDYQLIGRLELYLLAAFIVRLFVVGMMLAINNGYDSITRFKVNVDNGHSLSSRLSLPLRHIAVYFIVNPIWIGLSLMKFAILNMGIIMLELYESKFFRAIVKIILTYFIVGCMVYIAIVISPVLVNYINNGNQAWELVQLISLFKFLLAFMFCWVLVLSTAVLWTDSISPTLDDCLYKGVVLHIGWFICGLILYLAANIMETDKDRTLGYYLLFGLLLIATVLIVEVRKIIAPSH